MISDYRRASSGTSISRFTHDEKYDEYGAARPGEAVPTLDAISRNLVGLASDAQSHVDKSTHAALCGTISPR